MALLESKNIQLGTIMPDFSLKTPLGQIVQAHASVGKKGLLIVFTCNHCPYAQAIWDRFVNLANEVRALGINSIAVNPNINPDYPEDSAEKMVEEIRKRKIDFPYLVDESQSVAKLYDAQCTPDIYLLDEKCRLVYHGRFDDNWKDESRVNKQELRDAVLALVEGKKVEGQQVPSIGCSIKWVR